MFTSARRGLPRAEAADETRPRQSPPSSVVGCNRTGHYAGSPALLGTRLLTVEHVAPILAVMLVAVWVLVLVVGRVRRRRLASGSRQVTIGVPPDVDPGGALLLWSALHDLLRPRLARLLGGQPHLAWEVAASETGTVFRVWVPETIPPGLIERAVSSAWPGASTTTEPTGNDEPGEGMVQVRLRACSLRAGLVFAQCRDEA